VEVELQKQGIFSFRVPVSRLQMSPSFLLFYYFAITQNFLFSAILLGHLKMSVADLKNALYRMDEEIFTPELIQQMLAYSPNEEEVRIMK
jgi:hypothetical protein